MKWEYLSLRCSFKGLGITQEFSSLDVGGERLEVWADEQGRAAETLPELLVLVGEDAWELVTHAVHTSQTSGAEMHYLTFKRPKTDASVLR